MDASEGYRGPPAARFKWTQQERGQVPATAGRRASQVPPPTERESMSAATRSPTVASSQPQQRASRWPLPTRGRNCPPSPHTVGVRRGREASCDRPSPRPTSRPRHRSPSPSGGNAIVTPPSLPPGILGHRQRSKSPPTGRPHQRLRVTFTDDTRSQGALVPRREVPPVRGRRPWPSESVPTLSEIIASARAWSNGEQRRRSGGDGFAVGI